MDFKKIDRVSMSEEIVEYLKNEILSRRLKTGQRLPAEESLAESMGVGRGTVREALKVLIHMGLVERKRNGTFVTEGKLKPDVEIKLDEYRDIIEIIEVRKVIEPALAGFAARRADKDLVEKLELELDEMKNGAGNVDDFILHDSRFHDLVFEASGNTILETFIKSFKDLMKKNQAVVLIERYSNIMPKSLDFHEKIFKAISIGDEHLAFSYMYDHIVDVENEFKIIIEGE
ncbi:MAG: FadR/GntR family transcriptional regulator [Spirochaetia bacterium]|jgi:GntR family transcriptional repressor for pyruvate dehydrogenase complex|nr:FadR/GntR family transcriptional regulator [Spirochaetia bacterium]